MGALVFLVLFAWANGLWLGRLSRARFWPWLGRKIRGWIARRPSLAESAALATSRSTSTSG